MAASSLAVAPPVQELGRVKAEVERCGSATISGDEIEALCPGELSVTDQFLCVAELARAEGWEVDFGTDGEVRLISAIAARRIAVY